MEHALAGPEVQLHPQLLRNPLPSHSAAAQTSDAEDAAMPPPSPLATTPFFPGLDAILPTASSATSHRTSSRRPSPLRTPAAPQQPPRVVPAHGLVSLDATKFPLYSTTPGTPQVRVLSAHEFAHLHEQHCRVKLPETELFPWAHGGADIPHSAAAHYFGFRRGQAAKPPSYRGLTVIHAPPMPIEPSPGLTRNLLRRGLASSTDSWSSATSSSTSNSSAASLSQLTSSSRSSISSASPPAARLVSSFDASTILTTSRTTGETTFALPNPRSFENVNLRHLRLQAVKYATISDIVVYGENGIDQSVLMTAYKAKEAIDREHRRRGTDGIEYNVYVIADPFTEFERHYPRLVSIDSHGFSRNRLNFFEREREEMRVLTAATEIGPNVWLGNTQDVPVPKAHQRSLGADPTVANMDDGNPCSFSICIESHDQASLLSRDILDSATQVLDQLELQGGRVCEEVQPMLTADNELIETTKTLLRPNIDEVVHLETVSTAAALGTSTRAQDAFVAQVVDLAVWIRDQSAPNPLLGLHDSTASHPHAPRRVLLHCGDGYTETSLLALAYVMLSRRCAVSEAYLFLQIDCERSFFVYTADRETVLKLEQRVIEVLEREDEEERYTRRWLAEQRAVATFGVQTASALRRSSPAQDLASANNNDHLSSTSQQQQDQEEEDLTLTLGLSSSSMGRSDSGYVDSTEIVVDPLLDDDKTRCALEEEAARVEAEIEVACGGPKRRMRSADPVEDAWFFGPTFEGHFPSRILPHLYLGNVNHASNALMLKAIGITHVVSMGESALHPPPKGASGLSLLTSPFRSSSPALPSNSLWEEERNGTIEVLDMQNVADDGIDSIRPCIDEALEFIRTARQQGGKILVHCKVGVSRSASIVIAYLMREMGLDLASSYLLTRSRRLNILVQPNLPFIAALHAFEAELLEEKERVAALSRPRAAQGHSPSSSIGSVSEYGDCVDEKEELDSLQVLGQPGLKRSNRLAFSFLCGEIARLNERFLC